MADTREEAKEPDTTGVPATRANLEDPNVMMTLGIQASSLLQAAGMAAFWINEAGEVVLLNAARVFVGAPEEPPAGKVPKLGRPIIMDKRPRFVTVHEGQLYEVEYVDAPTPEDP